MPGDIRVYVNERGVTLPDGSLVRDAVQSMVPELLAACASGETLLTDGRGLPVTLEAPLSGGMILRVVRSSRRTVTEPDG